MEAAGGALATPLPSEVVGGKPRRLESSSDLATRGLRCRSCTARSMLQPEVSRRCTAMNRCTTNTTTPPRPASPCSGGAIRCC